MLRPLTFLLVSIYFTNYMEDQYNNFLLLSDFTFGENMKKSGEEVLPELGYM